MHGVCCSEVVHVEKRMSKRNGNFFHQFHTLFMTTQSERSFAAGNELEPHLYMVRK